MVNQAPITAAQQKDWFQRVSASNRCAHYLIIFRDVPWGLIYITALGERSLSQSRTIETGMYLAYDSPFRGTLLAFCPALAMNDYCFEHLRCEALVAKVKQENRAALRFNEKLGYRPVEERGAYIILELNYANHQQARKQLQRFIHFKEE